VAGPSFVGATPKGVVFFVCNKRYDSRKRDCVILRRTVELWATLLSALLAVPQIVRAYAGPDPELASGMDSILASPALEGATVGLLVIRLSDGQILYAKDPDTPMIPASNMKLISTAAVLSYLRPDYRFHTDVYGPAPEGGRIAGDLVIRGYGDPYLTPERMWYLANRIHFLDVNEITGDIVVDDTYFDGPRLANGWEQDLSSAAYMAPVGAVSVGSNALMIHVFPSPIPDGDARIVFDPPSDYPQIHGRIRTVDAGRTSISVDLVPFQDRSQVKVAGRILATDPGHAFWRRVDNPPVYAGEILKNLLARSQVHVTGKVRTGPVPAGVEPILTVTSPTLGELVGSTNRNSNNFMADQLARVLGAARYGAPGNWTKAQAAIEAFLTEEVGVDRKAFVIGNASGLHDVNRMTPRAVIAVLTYMDRHSNLSPEYISSLAIAAGTGTLRDRMKESDAAYLLRAKTGTLSIASALSGYVALKSGERVAFSMIVNDYKQPIEEIWSVQDQFGATLAGWRLFGGAQNHVATAVAPAAGNHP